MKKIEKLLIIGSGPSGYTAAIYAARANLKPILITGINEGGQIIKSYKIENWPGNKKINGYKLIKNMKKQALKFKTKIINDYIKKVNFKKKPFKIYGNNNIYFSKSIIIATGCKSKMLGLPIENKLYGKGISTCTSCDGYFYKNKIVAIIGGGNNAIEESLLLCKFSKKIFLIHRKNTFTADKYLLNKLKKQIIKKKIILIKNYTVYNLKPKKNLFILKIKSNIKNKKKNIYINGLFLAIGYIPNSKIFNKYIKLDKNKYIIINYKINKYKSMTNIDGIFSSGDVTNCKYKQAIIASSSGCKAALDVQKYLENI